MIPFASATAFLAFADERASGPFSALTFESAIGASARVAHAVLVYKLSPRFSWWTWDWTGEWR